MRFEKKQKPSALYECINLDPSYATQAMPLQVPIRFLAGRQVSADYSEKSMREVRDLYKKDSDEVLKILMECPAALCAILQSNTLSFIILNGHTRARLLPTAKGVSALPSLVYTPEQVVQYLHEEKNEHLDVSEFVAAMNSYAITAIQHFEMLMGDGYRAPQTITGIRSMQDEEALKRNGIHRFPYRSVVRA